MAALPDDLVAGLKEATVRAELNRIASMIDQVRERDEPLADALADLARDYDHERILALIKAVAEARRGAREGK
jgi:hypothetical protein